MGEIPFGRFLRELVHAKSPQEARRATEPKSPAIGAIHEIIKLLDNLHLGKK